MLVCAGYVSCIHAAVSVPLTKVGNNFAVDLTINSVPYFNVVSEKWYLKNILLFLKQS